MSFFLPNFGLGSIFYVGILLTNAICILSEDRFLARVGMGNAGAAEPAFGQPQDATGARSKIVNLINSLRTIARLPLIGLNLVVILYLLILG